MRRQGDGDRHSCSLNEYDLTVSKSTLAHHFKTLREAGITRTHVLGRDHEVELRASDLDTRWPGLVSAVVEAARREE